MAFFLFCVAIIVFLFGGLAWGCVLREKNAALMAAKIELDEGRGDGEYFIYERRKLIELIVRYGLLFVISILLILSFYFYFQPLSCKG